jgi:hypothetical protein
MSSNTQQRCGLPKWTAGRSGFLVSCAMALLFHAASTTAKLPAPTEEAKAKSAEAAAKAAWTDKVSLYKTCLVQDRLAEAYQRGARSAGKTVAAATPTTPCSDPGPYASTPVTPVASKPLEASEAHSPAGAATSPPSTNTPAAGMPKSAQ